MENKHVGFLVIGMAVLLIVIILLYHEALSGNISIHQQTYLCLAIVGVLIIMGFILIFTKPTERIIIKKVKEKRKKPDLRGLDRDEKKVVRLLLEENGTMFQATLKEKLDIGRVKLTRLLDKLEAKQLIERKRRGMNNIVVLKN